MKMTPDQTDALKELINIGVGRAASVLNEMLLSHIHLRVPFIKIVSLRSLQEEMEEFGGKPLSSIQLGFKGPFNGTAALVFPTDSASKLVATLIGDELESDDIEEEIRSETLAEIGNIVMNGVMGSIGNVLQQRINYSVPTYLEATIEHLLTSDQSDPDVTVLVAQTRFTIEQLEVDGDIMLFFEVGSFDALLASIDAMIESYSGE